MIWYGPPFVEVQTAERTFRSGLIESSWRRTCQADQVQSALSVSGNVFPEPSVRYENGLAVVEWTEYDKNNSQGFTTKGVEIINLSKSFEDSVWTRVDYTDGTWRYNKTEYRWTITEVWFSDTITTTKVVDSSASSSSFTPSGSPSKSLKQRFVVGNRNPVSPTSLTITWTTQVVGVNRRNYGQLDEVEITVGNVPTIQ